MKETILVTDETQHAQKYIKEGYTSLFFIGIMA